MIRDTLSEFSGKIVRGESFARLVQLVIECLPGPKYHWDTVEDSLRHLADIHLTPELLADTAWRMAGNHKRLRERRAVPPWAVQRVPEWVPMMCTKAVVEKRGIKMGAVFTWRIMAGTSCPRYTDRWWSFKQCRAMMAEQLGFSRRLRGREGELRYPYNDPAQFVTLRAYGLIDPKMSGADPVFSSVAFPPSMADWNREQIRHRFRKDPGYTCPRGYPRELPCHRCEAGFQGKAACRAGCHRSEWVEKPCPKCERNNWFDPDSVSEYCVDCTRKDAYRNG